jgi:transcriptional regulator with XRE-family HTH domain
MLSSRFVEYSPTALGQVIRDCREAHTPKLSQEELGRKAGYRAGAGVSMSRIENGVTRPSPRRLEGIAATLGLSVHELEVRSAQRSSAPPRTDRQPDSPRDRESTRTWMRRIQREFDRRQTQAVAQGQSFNTAHDRARDDFLLELVDSARGLAGLPTSPARRLVRPGGQSGAAAEAALRHRVAADGLAAVLASGAAALAASQESDREIAYDAVVAAAMLAPVPTDRAEVDPPTGATARATRALLGGGTMATVALLTGVVATAASPLIAAGALAWLARRSRRQNDQLRIELGQAESNLTATQPGFDAVMDLLTQATELLAYIALHASHALRRWRATLPAGAARWSDLSADQQGAYAVFVDVAAYQVCVDSINMTELLAAPVGQQAALIQTAGAILQVARQDVEVLI